MQKLKALWQRLNEPATLSKGDVAFIWIGFGLLWLEFAFKA